MNSRLQRKVSEFSVAINKYNQVSFYIQFEIFISFFIIAMQVAGFVYVLETYHFTSWFSLLLSLTVAYVATDFVNGIAHMVIDNNTQYTSFVGPYIAAFHLHHQKLIYSEKSALKIYFYETGHKFWLAATILLFVAIQDFVSLNSNIQLGLVTFTILSSIAEVSHFWCHNRDSQNRLIHVLQKYRLLLPMKHHRLHHQQDNMNYAFLNGMSDPLLNIIARYCYKGYKNHSDKHVTAYATRLQEEM